MNGIKNTIGGRIKAAREYREISQKALVEEINCDLDRPKKAGQPEDLDFERYRRWEDGTNGINLDWVPTICKHLWCDVGYLFGEYKEHSEDAAFICRTTGLSEDAVGFLTATAASSFPPELEPVSYSRIISLILSDRRFYDMVSLMAFAAANELSLYANHLRDDSIDPKKMEEYLEFKARVNDDLDPGLKEMGYSLVDIEELKNVYEYRIRQNMDAVVKETFDTVLRDMIEHFKDYVDKKQHPKPWYNKLSPFDN